MCEVDSDIRFDGYKLEKEQIKFLNMITNLSNIKQLVIPNTCLVSSSSSLLLELLKELPCVSSLKIDKHIIKDFHNNHELCEYLNRKINTLYIDNYYYCESMKSDDVNLLCKVFSNIEQLQCQIEKLDDFLSILRQCSKLSIINLSYKDLDVKSWIQMNASKLNVYIDYPYRIDSS
jgi:hypothetical protein